VSTEIAGICGAAGMRSIAPGVVGVEGCVGRDRAGIVDESAVNGDRMMRGKPGMGAGSGIGESVGEGVGDGIAAVVGVSVAGVGDGVAAVVGVGVTGVGDGVTLVK